VLLQGHQLDEAESLTGYLRDMKNIITKDSKIFCPYIPPTSGLCHLVVPGQMLQGQMANLGEM
jgi:hypothetical protein